MTCKCGKYPITQDRNTGSATTLYAPKVERHSAAKCDGYWELKAPSGG